ncbi:MAG TPA: GNAT family N-acetyltransferase [Nitrospira sp.]|nr:GNAT family N-acetyltransferase [Nitrospira sp.]
MNALAIYRVGHWCYERGIPFVPQLAYYLIYLLCRAVIPMSAEIGKGVELAYGGLGVVLHERTKIGRYVTVGHDVTIGGRSRRWGVPVIEDRCVIGAGAKLLGPISVGQESVIGANAVVLDDVPPNSVMAGMPAHVVRRDIDIHDYSCLQPPEEADRLSFRTSNNLLVTVIEDPARLEHLSAEWSELLNESEADCLFLTSEWLETWWRHFSRDKWTLHLVTVRRQSRLLGIMPLYTRPRTFGGLITCRSTEFLGAGLIGSDYLDAIIRRGEEEHVSRALIEFFERERPLLTLSHVPASSNGACGIARELEQCGWLIERNPIETCPYISLEGRTWESYLASLGSNHRYNFQRRLKNLQAQGTVLFDTVEKEDQRREGLDSLRSLHNLCWKSRGGSQAMQSVQEWAFHESFSRLALERGWLRLYLLRMNGRPIAALYGFLYKRRFYFYQSGYDPAWRRDSVGLITMGLAIKQAIAEEAKEYDLLHGTESYKFLWTGETRRLDRIRSYPPSMRAYVCRQALALEATGKQVARRYLPEDLLNRIIAQRRMGA